VLGAMAIGGGAEVARGIGPRTGGRTRFSPILERLAA